jgi:hypothetical protein
VGGKRITPRLINRYNGPRKNFKGKVVADRRYHRKYGKRFTFTYAGVEKRAWYYPGNSHLHWQSCLWNSKFRKWFFFDPCTRDYFCYSNECSCYVPTLYYCSFSTLEPDQPDLLPSGVSVTDSDNGLTDDETGNGDPTGSDAQG